MASQTQTVVPSFFLYGEAPRSVGEQFLHVEALDDRSRPSLWNIRPHAHANLNHVFFVASGGGEMRTDDGGVGFEGPCLLLVPVNQVHGFRYRPETTGSVVTVADAYLREIIRREPAFDALFKTADQIALPAVSAALIERGLERLAAEVVWSAPVRQAAIEASLVLLLVEALRCSQTIANQASRQIGPQAELVARFRALLEAHYRTAPSIGFYLEALHVSETRLRQACVRICGRPPLKLIHERALVEAKRLLLYSNMTVAEAGRSLGFDDPSYFSRFFSKNEKESPRAFRARLEGRRGES